MSVPVTALIAGIDGIAVVGNRAGTVSGVELDSRQVRPGDLFAALPGHRTHGARFAVEACSSGASALITDAAGWAQIRDDIDPTRVSVLLAEHPRSVLGEISKRAYGRAADDLRILGVTGTNGKTTVAHMVESGLRADGRSTGLIGTVGAHIGTDVVPAVRTTPEAPHLHALLAVMRQAGASTVVMEVSSHALSEGRVDGVTFDIAGFTNLSQDHLDYHGTMQRYFEAKAELFTDRRTRLGIIGIDDDWGRRLSQSVRIPVQRWSLDDSSADWSLSEIDDVRVVCGPDGRQTPIEVGLPGEFNLSNAVLAFAMLVNAGVEPGTAAAGIAATVVPGRMERVVVADGVRLDSAVAGIVDYAHSPDAIARAVAAARAATAGRVLVVLGAGGDRDPGKRESMGREAALGADLVFVTDDNPRSEDPAVIRRAVERGALSAASADSVRSVADRRGAIRAAVQAAGAGDTVLVLGKGHEQGQEVAGVVHPFDDRVELRAALAERTAP